MASKATPLSGLLVSLCQRVLVKPVDIRNTEKPLLSLMLCCIEALELQSFNSMCCNVMQKSLWSIIAVRNHMQEPHCDLQLLMTDVFAARES